MKQIWTVATRELNSFFDSLIAYIVIIALLSLSGLFTWLAFGNDIFFEKQATLYYFFQITKIALLIFIPALTMGLIAEENKSGTIELLLTKPISDWQIVFGKFLATLLLIVFALLLTIPYYITVANLGNIDHGATISGYIGLIFMSATFISIGIFASSISDNQIVGFVLALIFNVFFHWILYWLANGLSGAFAELLNYLSVTSHFESISRGVIDSKDIIYFLSIIFIGLFLTEISLAKRNAID